MKTMKWQELSVAERVKLAQDIWESIAADPNALPITDAERAYLDEQLAAYKEDPTGVPWSEVKARLIQVL